MLVYINLIGKNFWGDDLQIAYKNKAIEKICVDAYEAEKKHGSAMAEKIHLRIDQISAAPSVEELVQNRVGRCHLLQHNRRGQYAMDLIQPQRLVFSRKEDNTQVVVIHEIIDYH